jgi:hypothetical protein
MEGERGRERERKRERKRRREREREKEKEKEKEKSREGQGQYGRRGIEREEESKASRVESGWAGRIITRDLARGSSFCILSLFLGSLRVPRSLFLLRLLLNKTQRERHRVNSVYSRDEALECGEVQTR